MRARGLNRREYIKKECGKTNAIQVRSNILNENIYCIVARIREFVAQYTINIDSRFFVQPTYNHLNALDKKQETGKNKAKTKKKEKH